MIKNFKINFFKIFIFLLPLVGSSPGGQILYAQILPGQVVIGEVFGRVSEDEIISLINSGYYPVLEPSAKAKFELKLKNSNEIVVDIKTYSGRSPVSVHQLVFRFFNSEMELASAFITDRVDFLITESDEIAEDIEKSTSSAYIKHRLKPQNYIKLLAYNNKKFPLNAKTVRQALTIAINRKELLAEVYRNQAYFASGPLSEKSAGTEPQVSGYEHNPRKAIQMLRAEGWFDNNGDGILDRINTPFKITLIYSKGVLLDEEIARHIKIDWSKIGIEVKIIPLPRATIKYKLASHDYDVILMGFQFENDPEFFKQVFKSDGKLNFLGYHNATVERYFDLYQKANENSKPLLFKAIQNQIIKDFPAAFLFFPWLERMVINASKIENYRDESSKILPIIHWRRK